MVRSVYPVRLGGIFATPGALGALLANGETPLPFLQRHAWGDWGSVDAEDAKLNAEAAAHGGRLLSAYELGDGTRLWVITEADRSATTILLPEEY